MNRFSEPRQRILYWSLRTSARSDTCRTAFRGPIFGLAGSGTHEMGGSFSAIITRGRAAPEETPAKLIKSWINSINGPLDSEYKN
jgi:hypothetical protein